MFEDYIGRSEIHRDLVATRAVASLRAMLDRPADDLGEGCSVSQGVHFLLCPVIAPHSELGADGHPTKGGFLPPIPLPRRMWAASDIHFHQPLHLGDTVQMEARIASITPKSGSTGDLVFVDVTRSYSGPRGLCIEERQTIVYRGEGGGVAAANVPATPFQPDTRLWPHQRALTPDPVLLFRYSALTFNGHRIHYDLPYTRDVEGYPGLVVHGPLMATLLLDHAERVFGANRLARFAFRGRSPAFADAPMTLCARQDGSAVALAVLGPAGETVMSAEAQLTE